MMKIKYTILLLMLIAAVPKAWALTQDSDGYYRIGTAQDWIDFAALVNGGTNTSANARMVADIDLDNNQTMVGNTTYPYLGTFDGQGHTLTVAYNIPSSQNLVGIAPFKCVGSATIQNLHVTGSIQNQLYAAGGIAGEIKGNLTIRRCWVSASFYSQGITQGTNSYLGTIGGICS